MPVIDSTYLETPFLPDDPATMLSNGDFPTDIDVMIGATKDEGIIYLTGNVCPMSEDHKNCVVIRITWWRQRHMGRVQEDIQQLRTETLVHDPLRVRHHCRGQVEG